jgi:hypothetical protein
MIELVVDQNIGHISFDISHLTFGPWIAIADKLNDRLLRKLPNEKCQMIYDQ